MMEVQTILTAYDVLDSATCVIIPFGDGLINNTWKIVNQKDQKEFILQRVNDNVFKHPELIDQNLEIIGQYLSQHHHEYLFVRPLPAREGLTLILTGKKEYYRLFPFVPNSITHNTLTSPSQAFEAAKQFGKFTSLLSAIPLEQIHETLPNFHNLTLRQQQFREALGSGNPERIKEAHPLISQLEPLISIVQQYELIKVNPKVVKRITHHDTKINNVLFDASDANHSLRVIDLDTVMPGYFFSDVGDMIRTYVCPVSEEEEDFSKISFREEYFQAIVEGYYSEMKSSLTQDEVNLFVFAGKFMIYMQAIRFLTDYLNNDVYYGRRYEKHNFHRAINQSTLLQRLIEKEELLETIVGSVIKANGLN